MYIRNEENNTVVQVTTEEDIKALSGVTASVKWLFSSALKTISLIDGATSEASRLAFRFRLCTLLEENPGMIECRVLCDDRNNPPEIIAKCQTIGTVRILFDGGRGEYIYSFSTKELV